MSLGVRECTAGLPHIVADPPRAVRLLTKKIMVALPWQKQVSPITSFCVAQLLDKRRTSSLLCWGDAFVAHSRNSCVDEFLKTDLDYILFLDDDMVIPWGHDVWYNAYTGFNLQEPFSKFNTIDRLLSHGKTLVGGLYFGRYPGAKAVFNEGASNPDVDAYVRGAPIDECRPTKWVGTGCMMIHRSVFLDIERLFPRLQRGANGKGGQWFTSTEASLVDGIEKLRSSLHDGPLDGNMAYKALAMVEDISARARGENSLGMGEDVSFCIRAAAAGHQPYVDLGLLCGHIGHCVYGPSNTGKEIK